MFEPTDFHISFDLVVLLLLVVVYFCFVPISSSFHANGNNMDFIQSTLCYP